MRNDALMNGGLIGFGLGFIAATFALLRVVGAATPEYLSLWHFKGVIIVGAAGLVVGIVFEVVQRVRMKRRQEEEEGEEESEVSSS